MKGPAIVGIVIDAMIGLGDQRGIPRVADAPQAENRLRCEADQPNAAALKANERRTAAMLVETHPASPKITFFNRSWRKKLLPTLENPDAAEALHAVALLQRADEGVERRSFLRSRGEIEAAQGRGRLVARRLEDAIEEVGDRLSDRAELRRKSEQDRSRAQVRLILQPFGHSRSKMRSDEEIDLLGNLADIVGFPVGRSWKVAPQTT